MASSFHAVTEQHGVHRGSREWMVQTLPASFRTALGPFGSHHDQVWIDETWLSHMGVFRGGETGWRVYGVKSEGARSKVASGSSRRQRSMMCVWACGTCSGGVSACSKDE
jgi:hypothetical protein